MFIYLFYFNFVVLCFECQVLKCVVILLFLYRKNTECHFWDCVQLVRYSQGQRIPVGYRQPRIHTYVNNIVESIQIYICWLEFAQLQMQICLACTSNSGGYDLCTLSMWCDCIALRTVRMTWRFIHTNYRDSTVRWLNCMHFEMSNMFAARLLKGEIRSADLLDGLSWQRSAV